MGQGAFTIRSGNGKIRAERIPLSIEVKTTGQLIDESNVVWLKMQHGLDLAGVYHQYELAVGERVANMADHQTPTEPGLKLMMLNTSIWDLINIVVHWNGSDIDALRIARVAQQIQQLNRERVRIIQQINAIFGDPDIGQGVKLY